MTSFGLSSAYEILFLSSLLLQDEWRHVISVCARMFCWMIQTPILTCHVVQSWLTWALPNETAEQNLSMSFLHALCSSGSRRMSSDWNIQNRNDKLVCLGLLEWHYSLCSGVNKPIRIQPQRGLGHWTGFNRKKLGWALNRSASVCCAGGLRVLAHIFKSLSRLNGATIRSCCQTFTSWRSGALNRMIGTSL